MDDEELVHKVLGGNHGAFADLVARYTAAVRSRCRARVWRRDAVPDLVQGTFLRAWERLPTLSEASRFGPWLLGIARHLCSAWRRDLRNRQQCATDLVRADGDRALKLDPPQPDDDPSEAIEQLMAEVRRLPVVLRETLLMYYTGSHSYRELGYLLGVSGAAINKRLTSAREILRHRLGA
jgi:RNA polymerase sigma-70 factor (ECF subfamily)